MKLGPQRPHRWRHTTALTSAVLGMMLGGCGQELPEPSEDTLTSTTEQATASFEAWRAKHVVVTEEGHFLVEGDLRMPDVATVRQYWGGLQENPSALSIFRVAGNDAA